MRNPWERVPLAVYEAHMRAPHVRQLQTLDAIMGEQTGGCSAKTIMVLGVAGGNGLEHIDCGAVDMIYGIDISQDYLDACQRRYAHLGRRLTLMRADLSDMTARLPSAELVIANLVVEYIGIQTFTKLIAACAPHWLSCAIQQSGEAAFVSASPYAGAFSDVAAIHEDIDKTMLAKALDDAGYALLKETHYPLPGHKSFVRLDFINRAANKNGAA